MKLEFRETIHTMLIDGVKNLSTINSVFIFRYKNQIIVPFSFRAQEGAFKHLAH